MTEPKNDSCERLNNQFNCEKQKTHNKQNMKKNMFAIKVKK